ncbi:MAG: hypothetical protein VW684_13490 [Betaproteobacteria bacterium]
MKKFGLGMALAVLFAGSASAGVFDLFRTILQSTQAVKAGVTIQSDVPVGFYDEVQWDDAEYK